MKFRGSVGGLITLAILCAGSTAFACGDKFLVAGRGARFQRGGVHGLVVLVYAPPSSTLRDQPGSPAVDSLLRRAGYHPAVAATPEELDRILKENDPAVLLADIADAQTVGIQRPAATSSGPVVIPVLPNATRQELAEARKTWGVALKSHAGSDALLDALDEAIALRAKARKSTNSKL